jgi:hypothetical protein
MSEQEEYPQVRQEMTPLEAYFMTLRVDPLTLPTSPESEALAAWRKLPSRQRKLTPLQRRRLALSLRALRRERYREMHEGSGG